VSITFLTKKDVESKDKIETLMGQKIPLMSRPEEVEVSGELTVYEMPEVKMKNVLVSNPDIQKGGGAFHEKIGKNKKVNMKIRRAEAMRLKYGKPKKKK
ncbi:MAG: ATP-dependent helicase, partial [Paludibacter sp.]|nr:ATP-dependent helicase [Paludibacter sp.]